MTADFQTAFDPHALCKLAWGRSFERGSVYVADGRVKRLRVGDNEVSATVRGARAYRVRLWIEVGKGRFSGRRFRVTHIMESLAGLSGDADDLIAIKAHDLSSPSCFVDIAAICREAGRHEDALAWAERGLQAYPGCSDVRLLEVLAEEYERCGRGETQRRSWWRCWSAGRCSTRISG